MTFRGKYPITLNYPTSASNEPRWGYGKPPHPSLYKIIDKGRQDYAGLLLRFLDYGDKYAAINVHEDEQKSWEPHLATRWLPGLDSLALYCLLALYRPATYIEIGSGMSTKFARRSILDNGLQTKLISIDPEPRAEIDAICDQVWRQSVEEIDISIFDQLGANDILFVDSSHRCFMNSDVTVVFLDVLPRLNPGVLVEIHDVFLPNDYPLHWTNRYYNEQYLLAAYVMAGGQRFDVLLPNAFISTDQQLQTIVAPVFAKPSMSEVKKSGGSFWLMMK